MRAGPGRPCGTNRLLALRKRRWFNEVDGPWASYPHRSRDIKESGQWTIAVVRTRLRAEASGVELELTAALLVQAMARRRIWR
jgi:hypothetical protein